MTTRETIMLCTVPIVAIGAVALHNLNETRPVEADKRLPAYLQAESDIGSVSEQLTSDSEIQGGAHDEIRQFLARHAHDPATVEVVEADIAGWVAWPVEDWPALGENERCYVVRWRGRNPNGFLELREDLVVIPYNDASPLRFAEKGSYLLTAEAQAIEAESAREHEQYVNQLLAEQAEIIRQERAEKKAMVDAVEQFAERMKASDELIREHIEDTHRQLIELEEQAKLEEALRRDREADLANEE